MEIISGTKAPDCRLSLRAGYNRPITREVQKIINEIQSKKPFNLKDGMWFRVKDFDGKFEHVEIRQTITKDDSRKYLYYFITYIIFNKYDKYFY